MKYNWETIFDTANETMTHLIHPRLQLVLNWNLAELSAIKDGKVFDKISFKDEPFSLGDYERLLKQLSESAEKL